MSEGIAFTMNAVASRVPTREIRYHRTFTPDSTDPLSPTTTGEYLWPVAYRHEDGDTIIGLSYIPPVACPT